MPSLLAKTWPLALLIGALSRPAAAAPALDDCEAAVRSDPKSRDTYICFYSRARGSSDYDTEIANVRALAEEHPEVPWLWISLGNMLEDQSRPGAIEAVRRGIDLMAQSNDISDEAEVFSRIDFANTLRHHGRASEAKEQLQAAKRRAERNPTLDTIAELELTRHATYTEADYEGVLQRLAKLRPRLFPDGPYQARVVWLNTAKTAHRRLGRAEAALASIDELRQLAHDERDSFVEAAAALAGAVAYADIIEQQALPDLDGYRARLDKAEQLAAASRHVLAETNCICRRAELEADDQLERARQCLAALNGLQVPSTSSSLASSAALSLEAAGADGDEVRAALALAEVPEGAAPGAALAGRIAKMLLTLRSGETHDAVTEAESAVLDLRALLAAAADFPTAAEQGASWRGPFAHIAAELSGGDAPEADVARALRLHDATLGAAWDAVMTGGTPIELDAAAEQWLDRLQGAIRTGEAVLVYSLDELESPFVALPRGGSRVWLVTASSITAHPLAPRHRIAAAVRAWRGALEGESSADEELRLAESVGTMLLADVVEHLPDDTRHLVVVSDAEVHSAPFSALVVGATKSRAAQRWSIERAPNVRDLMQWRTTAPRDDRRPIHVLASPTNTADPQPPLGRAESEAARIAQLYGPDTVVRRGKEASEAHVFATAGQRSLLHVAAHASVSGGAPLKSALHLAADDEHDGEVTVAEVFEHRFDGEVVVLSSCETFAGVVLPGEGLAGLGQAFFNRGARAVVGTLWPVRDDDAAQLSADLYDALAGGASLSDALSQARRRAIEAHRPTRAWAGYVLLGDGRVTLPSTVEPPSTSEEQSPAKAPTSPRWWLIGIALALAGLAIAVLSRRARRLRSR